MNITFEAPDKVSGLLTITLEKDDYQPLVDKKLKDIRRKAAMPGFRPGQVPAGMIRRQYAAQAKLDTVNSLLGEKLYGYVREQKIQMLGEPMPDEAQQPVDIEKEETMTFKFDIAVAPEIAADLTADDTLPLCKIQVSDQMVSDQIQQMAQRAGHQQAVDSYDPEKRDMLKGDLRELDADGSTKEGGITVADAVMMPEYIKADEEKAKFDGAAPGSIITFNPKRAYPEGTAELTGLLKITKEQAETLTADFSYQVTEISRYVAADIDQKLFDQVYGEGACKSEDDFRARVAEAIAKEMEIQAKWKFQRDMREYLTKKAGEPVFPDELLKRMLKQKNKDKGDDYIEQNYAPSRAELLWQLIKDRLCAANSLKVERDDVKKIAVEMARMQFAQYGMDNVPAEYLEQYAEKTLKEGRQTDDFVARAQDEKLAEWALKTAKIEEKTCTLDEFNQMMK